MKCQEVMELIQRHLDQELTKQELEAMNGHLKQCAACAGMYARMEQLSEDLVSLPKVSPAYSLVDHILPRLQEIDELRSQGMDLDDNGRPLNEQSVAERESGLLGRLKRATFVKAASGIAAAAVLVLVVVTAVQPSGSQLDNAGEARLDAADSASANQLAYDSDSNNRVKATSGSDNSQASKSSAYPEDSAPPEAEAHLFRQAPDSGTESSGDTSMDSFGNAGGQPDVAVEDQGPSAPVSSDGEPASQQPQEGYVPLADDKLDTSEEGQGISSQEAPSEPGLMEPRYAMNDQPVEASSSSEVERLETSMSSSGELTAYIEESSGLYRLAVHETSTGAALYVGSFMETQDVPVLTWSEEEDSLVIMRYKLEDETYRLAVNARERSEDNIQE